nr:glycosyltransferase [Ignatzschineria ureiclastica]
MFYKRKLIKMIPKKIHYVWVGNNPKSQLILNCIESWKTQLPDYELIEWGNESIKDIDIPYLHEAYEHKKWAFVSDVIRLYALYTQGGIYLDTDVEVRDSFNSFLEHDFFSGYELHNNIYSPIVTAVMGASPQNSIIKDLLDNYKCNSFITDKNRFNLLPNTARVTKYFEQKFKIAPPYDGETTLYLTENSIIYPYYFFCTPKKNKPNYSIHLFDGSWIPGFSRRDKITFAGYSIARFKRVANNEILDLGISDQIILIINVSKNKKFALIRNG